MERNWWLLTSYRALRACSTSALRYVLLSAVCVGIPFFAHAQTWEVESWDAQYTIHTDGTVQVETTFTADIPDDKSTIHVFIPRPYKQYQGPVLIDQIHVYSHDG